MKLERALVYHGIFNNKWNIYMLDSSLYTLKNFWAKQYFEIRYK